MTLGEKMIRFRARNKLSQVKFAEMCEVSVQTICNVENGTQNPSKLTREKIIMAMEGDDESEHIED